MAGPLDFPNNPANGQTYAYEYEIALNGTIFKRDVIYTYSSIYDAWTGKITQTKRLATPDPDEVSASPAFENALDADAGTEANPYIVPANTNPTPGGVFFSTTEISFKQQVSGEKIYIYEIPDPDNPKPPGDVRFDQPLGFVDGYGNCTVRLRFEDEPTSTIDGTVYSAILRAGNTYFAWQVTQQVQDAVSQLKPPTVSVTGNVWNVGQTASMVPGEITGGVTPYTYQFKWQGSTDNDTWFDLTELSSEPAALNYTLKDSDQGYFIRGVTIGTDSTSSLPGDTVDQVLPMFTPASTTEVRGGPILSDVVLRKVSPGAARFTQMNYQTSVLYSNPGTGSPALSIQAVFGLPDSSVLYGVINSAGGITGVVSTDPGFVTTVEQGASITLQFPAEFNNVGSVPDASPDAILPEGTTMTTVIKSENAFDFSILASNVFQPETGKVIIYPKPDVTGSALTQYDDPLIADMNPFNATGVYGSNKAEYGFTWLQPSTTITFDPVWDTSATPITQFQGGGRLAGNNDFIITFTDEAGAQTSVQISTLDANWATAYDFATHITGTTVGFVPPTKIRSIGLQSIQTGVPLNGLVGFYDANNQPVKYEEYSASQNRLDLIKAESVDAVQSSYVRNPKVAYEDGHFHVLHYNKAGDISATIEVAYLDGTVGTLTATDISTAVPYDTFISNLVAGLSTHANLTVTKDKAAIKIDPNDGYGISTVRTTVTTATTSEIDVHTLNTAAETLITYNVTVAAKTSANSHFNYGSSNAYYLNTQEAPKLTFARNVQYKFDQSDTTNATHGLRLYLDPTKQTEYTDGVTTVGVPGTAGAYTLITVSSSTPSTLYYQCTNHAFMGAQISVA